MSNAAAAGAVTMSDEEMDREWKPNARRPQSTVAQMFSQELMDIFRIDNSVADLDEKVDKRKQQINTQTSELEALEARIREMEARLKGQASPIAAGSSSKTANASTLPVREQQQQKHAGSRPGTARQGQPAVPGALPPTPAGSEDGDRERDV
jgi:TolA-binding protein